MAGETSLEYAMEWLCTYMARKEGAPIDIVWPKRRRYLLDGQPCDSNQCQAR